MKNSKFARIYIAMAVCTKTDNKYVSAHKSISKSVSHFYRESCLLTMEARLRQQWTTNAMFYAANKYAIKKNLKILSPENWCCCFSPVSLFDLREFSITGDDPIQERIWSHERILSNILPLKFPCTRLKADLCACAREYMAKAHENCDDKREKKMHKK